jgi:hypothetical protein
MEPGTDAVRYLSVRFDGDGVSEWQDGRQVVVVPRAEIVEIELRRGPAGERPVVQLVLGAASVLLGAVCLVSLFERIGLVWSGRIAHGGIRLLAASALFLILGAYVVISALRPAYLLRVATQRGARKLVFTGKADLASIAAALRQADERFGYTVQWAVADRVPGTPPYRS